MTAKEKAKELVDKFYVPLPLVREVITKVKKIPFEYDDWKVAKQCALIAVDEILDSVKGNFIYSINFHNYWKEVKQEIEKL
tara:strand:+ start:186 stop:428 length:243 start_codon:yes stop_codon:yes gene_type:complete